MKNILRFCKKRVLDIIYRVNYKVMTRKPHQELAELSPGTFFRLDIPTYDGSGQAVHPSVLCRTDSPRFLLSFTPYTDTDDRVENPSVVVSDDGLSFREEKEGLNPLVPAPEKDHNDDPDLFFSNGKYCILYLETLRPEKQNLVLLESSDRLRWEKRIIHEESIEHGGCFMLSPKYVEKDGLSYLFYVNRDASGGYRIEYVKGKDIESLDFDCRNNVTVSGLEELPWHLDILRDGENYYMLLVTARDAEKESRYTLNIARSQDLVRWNLGKGFSVKDCYRSSGFIKDNMAYLYISKIFFPAWRRKKWKILLYKAELPGSWNL